MRRLVLPAAALVALWSAPAAAATGPVLVVGDSLVLGTTPYLRAELSGVRIQSDGRIGRPSGEAVGILRSMLGGQRVVVFDAGVNDDPGQPSRLSNDLAAVRSLVGGRCLVVATMSRPPYRGVTVDGLNRAVRSFAASTPNAVLVDWRAQALAHPQLINSDGVHPTGAGYRLRARLFAQAIRSCGSGGTVGGGTPPPPAPAVKPPKANKPPRRPHKRHRRPRPPAPAPELGSQSPVLIDAPVTFASGGARLSGELIAPAGKGRHPAVVMIPGSGRASREPYREQAEFLAEHGVAALLYDKRRAAGYSQLAADARAAVALLRTRPEVRADAVGVWGFGEGSLIAPMVAAGNPAVAAVMVVSPAALPSASQREWAVRRALDAGGADAGTGAVSRYYSVASDADLRLDPVPFWRRVSQPVLAVWGTADHVAPAHDSATALRAALASGAVNRDRVFRSFAGASHSLGVTSEGDRPGSAPGFKELSAAWLRSHLGPRRPTAVVSTPLPPNSGPPVAKVQQTLLERVPVQLAWLLLPVLGLLVLAARRSAGGVQWWWLAGVAVIDLLSLATLAYAVAAIVDAGGRDIEAVAGVPTVLLMAWVVTIAGVVATALLARRARLKSPATGVVLAGSAWLLLAVYWLV